MQSAPELSVVVAITRGESHIDRCLRAIASQKRAPATEIIVPVYASVDDVKGLRQRWPGVSFIEVPEAAPRDPSLAHWLFDRRKAIGLGEARASIVAMTEDHTIPGEDWCVSIIEQHKLPHAIIGGPIEHSGSGILNWVVFLCDFGRYRPPKAAGPVPCISDINVSYKRAALEKYRDLWSRQYDEMVLHATLRAAGETLWLAPELTINHDRGHLDLASILPERFAWARVFAGRRALRVPKLHRAALALLSPGLPLLLATRCFVAADGAGRHYGRMLAALPAMLLLLLAWSLGELTGYVTGRPYKNCSYEATMREVG